MGTSYSSFRLISVSGLFLIIQMLCFPLFSQSREYKVITEGTDSGIGYVNVVVHGRNAGTVTDEAGRFGLDFAEIDDNDSLRFSMIGYESRTVAVRQLKSEPSKIVTLKSRTYELPEMKVVYPRGREVVLGVPVVSNALRSGFADNNLGSELGIKFDVKKRLKLKDIYLNIGVCTYDSVTYRLNIYHLSEQETWENILTKPVYIFFSKKDIVEPVTLDLKDYSIFIEGQTIITLELYRDPGEGKLLFLTQFFTGTTYHRKTKEAPWTLSPGQIGMYLHGQTMR
jgi:hypothetical protein